MSRSSQNSFIGLWAPTLGRNLKIGNLDGPALARQPIKLLFLSRSLSLGGVTRQGVVLTDLQSLLDCQ